MALMPSREFGHRTGHIDLLDYDQAVVEGLGAKLDTAKNQYWLSLMTPDGAGIFVKPEGSDAPTEITKALVRMKQAEPTRDAWDLPCVLVLRDDFTPSQTRVWSPTEAYRLPAPGATPVVINGCLGWTAYETKPKEDPYDFSYTIECWSRYRTVAQVLLQIVLARYPLFGKIVVTDGLGVERTYHTFLEGTADLTEINSMVDRVCGFSASIRVEGEMTGSRVPQITPGFTGPVVPYDPNNPGNPFVPGNPTEPNPGPGGLYGDGQPTKRVTAIGSDE